jgi:hypothetical protein
MTILVFGSRDWTDKALIREVLVAKAFPADTLFIHGDNGYDAAGRMLFGRPDEEAVRGADKLAGAVARAMGYQVQPFPADWRGRGRAAGPYRNEQMAQQRPDLALCFHHNLRASRGSMDMFNRLGLREIPVEVFDGRLAPTT